MTPSEPSYWRVRNWERFQHYRNRNPPWIKLYTALLTDYDFGRLQDASKAHTVGLYLLASRLGNKVPNDPEWVARQINATEPVDLQLLADKGFLEPHTQDASNPLAESKQGAMPERETKGERKKEKTGSSTSFKDAISEWEKKHRG